MAVAWANGFQKKHHEVVVIANLYDPITYHLEDGITIRNLVSDNHNKFKKWVSAFINVRKQLKIFRPDVIIGVMETCTMIAKIVSTGMKIPIIMTEHWSFERPNNLGMPFIYRLSKFYINKIYDMVTVLTEVDKMVIGNRLKHVSVMPNPLALEPVQNIPSKEKIILAAGRLDGWHVKGYDVLIKAWGLLIHNAQCTIHNEGWRLQIAGTGSEESLQYLKSLCKENGVEDSVDFLGFVSDMESLYKKASVFVLSSRYKGRQREIMETLPDPPCLGRGAEVQNAKGDPFFETNNGVLCEPENVEALAAALKKMIEDEDYRESVRQPAIERSKYYSIENTIDRWEELLKKVVHS